ncbi:MAG: hypothetical protein L3J32_09705 [Rhizobiaceae bacterium]|nr:hypothetical protein [Rhizobiaceae bacterium]
MTSFKGENARQGSLKQNHGTSILLGVFVVISAVYLLLVNVLGKIGLSESSVYGMVVGIPIAVFFVTGFATRTLGPGNSTAPKNLGGLGHFQNASGSFGAVHNAMAGAAEWFSVFFVIGIIAAFTATNHDGLALTIGAFLGFAFVSIAILPKFSGQLPTSFASAIYLKVSDTRPGGNVLRLAIAFVIILSAIAFLTAQIEAGSRIINLYFPLPPTWAAILLVLPVLVTILAGGMRGLTIANMMLYFIIGATILLPAIWLSMRITGNPVPQFSFGGGALQPIQQLEQQLAQSADGTINTVFEHGNFVAISGTVNFITTLLVMLAGTAALPLLYSRVSCVANAATRIRSVGWIFILVAVVLSAMPAFVSFMKFEYYRSLVGLPVNQLGENVGWLMKWAVIDGGRHALVCGSPAVDLPSIIAACGNNPDYVLMPNDLQFSAVMTLLGAGEVAGMPVIFSALIYAGALSASATTAGIAMMVIINTATSDLIFKRSNQPVNDTGLTAQAPIARRLFISRLLLIGIVVIGIWLSQTLPVPTTDFSLWAFAIAAGAIFPVLLLAIWWKSLTPIGGLSGLLVGFVITSFLLITIEFGGDWVAQNGDELVFVIGGDVLKPINSAIFAMAAAFGTAIIVSVIERYIVNRHTKSNITG